MNRQYFFVTDQVEQGNLIVKYQPTEEMVADYNTKALQGKKFLDFREEILGLKNLKNKGRKMPGL